MIVYLSIFPICLLLLYIQSLQLHEPNHHRLILIYHISHVIQVTSHINTF